MLLQLDCAARAKSKALKLISCKSFYSDEHLEALRANLQRIEGRTNDLLLKYTAHSFANEKARELLESRFRPSNADTSALHSKGLRSRATRETVIVYRSRLRRPTPRQ